MSNKIAISLQLSAISFFFVLSPVPCSLTIADAAPCYGTRMPDKGKFFSGVQTHVIFKRYLEDDFGKVRSQQHFLLLSYGILDWLSLDLKGGAGNIRQHPVGADEIDYASSFAGGYGLRFKIFRHEPFESVLGFQHISVHPKSTAIAGGRNSAILDDWQVSLLLSYVFKKITPYIGTKLSRVDYIHRVEGDRKRRMSDLTKSVGLAVGTNCNFSDRLWLNLEGQWFDGETMAVSLNYAF